MGVRSTIAMISRHQMISLMPLLVAMLSGCASEKAETEVPAPPVVIEEPQEPESMSLLLACAPANSNSALTRLAENVVQSGSTYRPITNFRFIAQKTSEGSVTFSDSSVDDPSVSSDYTEDTHNFRYYHSAYCSMASGVNACLVYAKADVATPPAGIPSKVYNGSLKPEINDIPTWMSSSTDLQFSLESILDVTEARESEDDRETWEKEAWTLANALTDVVNDSHDADNTLVWKTSTNSILRNLLQRFTNNGADLPGSAASVKQWMLDLARSAEYYRTSSLSAIGDDEKALLAIIKAKATTAAGEVTVNYPRNINLPDGAAALRWTGDKFEPQMQTTTLDDINSVSRFVYPPALYYFVDSEIRTSTATLNYVNFLSTTTWAAFLTANFPGQFINATTRTVAVKDPLQYAVAHLTMEVKAGAEFLEYGAGNTKTIPISDLKLKGVIIGGQRSVGYDFKPISNSLYDVNFVYDSQVSGPLNTAGETYHTLALQSYDGENVNIILEFEYSGSTGFKCLNGFVYPGTRFYLVGEVKLDANALNETDDYKKRVFTQDYTTTIKMTVNSLENAYNVLPSLLSNSLEIGVMITPQWFSATPSGPVVME